ncbi:hypothetical protein B9Z65_2911 [Elsinoe australis]|uniref:C2H2-type domain-containing protein n=1 Tax=Elsinoe australis TaxID=40998 RepID=A0A2P7ZTX1_9PEZI|nr:hypothetical protein B9Z65_2911 [Elsinoe australis]
MSSGEDFSLYSFSDSYDTSSAPQYASYMPTTSYDSYPSQQVVDKSVLTSQSPSYSPAMSTSNSYEMPSHYASASDCGASGPSTISSAMASPSLSGQNSAEWQQGGLGVMVHDEFHHPESHYGSFDNTENFSSEKIPGCVGESMSISSASFPTTTSISSFSTNASASYPPLQQDRFRQDSQHEVHYGQHFKAPSTPASAARSPHPVSPAMARVAGHRRASLPSARVAAQHMSSPLAQEQMSPEEPMTPHPQQRAPVPQQGLHQPPFFSQSSGVFVPPLQSSYPSLIEPFNAYTSAPYPTSITQSPRQMYVNPPSPAMSQTSYNMSGPIRTESRASQWQPYPRSHSVMSAHSHVSRHSSGSNDSDENKVICPIASCGRPIRDLKAHMLTHQSERPEKCPIPSCPYHLKGFARKYDKNRHTLTHYKGTMVCDFCPGSGSSSEKSFNRTDVFKRHLQSVHNVEQTTPNSRRRKPAAAKKGVRETPGVCRTCGVTFASAQELHDHIDDCVLRIVQQTEPSEEINERLLSSVADDEDVKATLTRHNLPTSLEGPTSFSGDEEDAEDDSSLKAPPRNGDEASEQSGGDCGDAFIKTENNTKAKSGKGLTWSKGGVALNSQAGKGRRKRNYPLSWGASQDKMRMKKRVLCVYDGQRRLCKDDMMLSADNEVRIPLPGTGNEGFHNRRWITDLDILTMRRAEAFHGATAEERGPWMDDDSTVDIERLMAIPQAVV